MPQGLIRYRLPVNKEPRRSHACGWVLSSETTAFTDTRHDPFTLYQEEVQCESGIVSKGIRVSLTMLDASALRMTADLLESVAKGLGSKVRVQMIYRAGSSGTPCPPGKRLRAGFPPT
jgi:hypothetical protein